MGIRSKLLLGIMIPCCAIFAVASYLLYGTFETAVQNRLRVKMAHLNGALALINRVPLATGNLSQAEQNCSAFFTDEEVVAIVLRDAAGNELVKHAATGVGGNEISHLIQVEDDGERLGEILITYSTAPMMRELAEAGHRALIFVLVTALLLIVVVGGTSALFLRPLREIRRGLQFVDRGNYTYRLHIHSRDEFRDIEKSFNQMASSIAESHEKIRRYVKEIRSINRKLRQEVHERQQVAEALQAEKERLAVTLRSIGEGVIATDTEGCVLVMNRAAEIVTEYEQEAVAGRHLDEVLKILNRRSKERIQPHREVLESGDFFEPPGDCLLITPKREERVVTLSAGPLRDRDSGVHGVVVAFRDITARANMAEQLAKQQKLESIGILAGGIAHDFNNILQAITGNLALAKEDLPRDSEVHVLLNDAENAALRARDLTHQLLTFSKGGTPVRRTSSLAQIIEDSVHFTLRGSGVGCEISLPTDLKRVDIDPGQINQVIQNIVINGIQAMPNGGVLRIEGRNVERTNAPGLPGGSYVKLSITDTGVGIEADVVKNIFAPFFTTKEQGTGLGLAVSYSIINNHDGHIEVESSPGKGTTFHLFLPVSSKRVTPLPPPALRASNEAGGGRILVMDDETVVRTLLTRILARFGYTVDATADGDEALQHYSKALHAGNRYDVVILDLTVPGKMGGVKCIEELLRLDPNVRAIVSSGYSNDKAMANYRQHGFAGILVKPFTVDALRRELQAVMSKTPSAASAGKAC